LFDTDGLSKDQCSKNKIKTQNTIDLPNWIRWDKSQGKYVLIYEGNHKHL